MLVIIKLYNCIYIRHIVFCCKEKEHEDEQFCITVHTINNNIHNTNPLDNSGNEAQLSQHCLT